MPSAADHQLGLLVSISPAEQDAVRALAAAAGDLDGAEPLNEATLLRLRATDLGLTHIVATRSVAAAVDVIGYAQVQLSPSGAAATAEVLVGPAEPRAALAEELLAAAEQLAAPDDLLVWSRGRSPVGSAAAARGFRQTRGLMTMRRPLAGLAGDPPAPPPGITLGPFRPGIDDADWLAVNAAAFATHPEQGSWTAADLADRLAQPWFDPNGFFLAHDADGTLLGYHWTKLHPPARTGAHPVGEVYVLGIAPAAQGRGLGRVLLDAGLRYLAAGPAEDVILYVEQDNTTARALYERNGFGVERLDAQFRHDGSA
jgi:mycothiol synthase